MGNSLVNSYPKLYARRTVTVPANGVLEVSIYGRYFGILSNDAQDILVSFNDQKETILDTAIGIQIAEGVEVTKAVFRNDTGTDKTLTYAVADERFEDFRNTIEGIVDVDVQAPANCVTAASLNDVTTSATQIVAARATRKSLSIDLALGAGSNLVFVGTNAAGTVGKVINAGDALEDIRCTGAIYCLSDGSTITAADIIVTEVY